ncbi:MAG: EAL and HDOD domain-containing protein [Aquificaceae bacterium]
MSFLIAKQPIFDKEGKRIAFEVFLRKKDNIYEYPKEVPYNRATYIIIEILLEQGIDKVGEGKRVMINVSLDSLLNKAIEFLNPEKLILEIMEPQLPLGSAIYNLISNVISKYIQQGAMFCINEKNLKHEKLSKIFEKMHIVSVNADRFNKQLVDMVKKNGKFLLISKIEDDKNYKELIIDGDFFQGIYLEKPTILKEFETGPYLKATLFKVLAIVNTAGSLKEIANSISTDVGMAAKILRLVNSAHYSPVKEIKNIEHACSIIGLKNLKNFLLMLAINDYVSVEDPVLWEKSLVRALIAQKIAEILSPEYESKAYLMGLFSLIDKILFVDKIAFLKEIKLEQDIIDGYTGRNGTLKRILDYSILIEEKFSELLEDQSISESDVLTHLQEATGIEKETLASIAKSAFSMVNHIFKI